VPKVVDPLYRKYPRSRQCIGDDAMKVEYVRCPVYSFPLLYLFTIGHEGLDALADGSAFFWQSFPASSDSIQRRVSWLQNQIFYGRLDLSPDVFLICIASCSLATTKVASIDLLSGTEMVHFSEF